jgi:hypothetical protein
MSMAHSYMVLPRTPNPFLGLGCESSSPTWVEITARLVMTVHLDLTVVRGIRANKNHPRALLQNPSTICSFSSPSLAPHWARLTTTNRRARWPSPRWKKAVPPRAPSLVCAPTNGWTRCRRVASWWRPTTHSAGGNLMGESQLLPARRLRSTPATAHHQGDGPSARR